MRVTEPRALRALAHPLRLDLLEDLGVQGPSTAAECARRLDQTQANCSYHLRLLARYGFVEQAEAGGDARERRWRLTDVRQSWAGEGPDVDELERVFVEREAARILAWHAVDETEPAPWTHAGFLDGATLPLTPEELREVHERLAAVLEPYVARLGDPASHPAGARRVRVLLAGSPAVTA